MQNGSLTIGDTLLNYGGGNNWTANTAGLMFECLNNTEIAVHDAGKRVSSLIYYEGDLVNRITIGRNMGWDAISSIVLNGSVYVGTTTPNSGAAFDVGGTSTSTFYTFLNGLRISGRDISIYHNVVNSPLAFHTNWGSTSNDYISFSTRSVARLTIDGAGAITCNSDSLNFPNTLNQYKINLYGTNSYGFGIAGSTLQYSSQGFHKFYNSGNNANTFYNRYSRWYFMYWKHKHGH